MKKPSEIFGDCNLNDLPKDNDDLHSMLFEKHVNFTPTTDGLNASVKCFAEHGRVSGTFMQNLKLYAEEYRRIYNENVS